RDVYTRLELSRNYADFIREQIVNPRYVNAHRPVLVNNWEATYFDFDNEKLFPIIDEASKLGLDTFVLDDGWFGVREDATSGLGDWFVNENKLKGGLSAIIQRCKQRKLKFGLWFEPEMISENSDLYRTHPEWAIQKQGCEPARMRNQLVLDFTRSEVVDYVYTLIANILQSNDISYVKWDMNRYVTECYSASLPSNRQGEFFHRYVLGVYALASRLTQSFPKVFFEGCASGGGRFDAGMLYYFPQIWTSDDTDAYERAKIQWGTSMCYPLSSMSCHVSACPNHQTQRTTSFSTRGAIASLGATGYELDLSKLTDGEKLLVKQQVENYKQIQDLILQGDLYRLSSPFDSPYFAVMVVDKTKTNAYVVVERGLTLPRDVNRIIRLNGLDDDKTYYVEELDITASGKALHNCGIVVP
ncbi:MAG: alpha-galactosidase, partial [Clostridia bacterium]|nr:alpha-galactosidase [Clostridia bacterium]